MLVFPFLHFLTLYYSFKPFESTKLTSYFTKFLGTNNYLNFIIIGYLGLMFFQCFIMSAMMFSRERVLGTLELIYLSPANIFSILLGNAITSLINNVWMFTVFSLLVLYFFTSINILSLKFIFIIFAILVIPSICWGIFLNSIFLYSRDTRILFVILQAPLHYFCGVRIPLNIFPYILRIIGFMFPLSWSLIILRKLILYNLKFVNILNELIMLIVLCLILIIISLIISSLAEKHAKKTGNLTFF